eukprot:Rmarinus@m.25183
MLIPTPLIQISTRRKISCQRPLKTRRALTHLGSGLRSGMNLAKTRTSFPMLMMLLGKLIWWMLMSPCHPELLGSRYPTMKRNFRSRRRTTRLAGCWRVWSGTIRSSRGQMVPP